MYTHVMLPVKPAVAAVPARMPLRIMLALPDNVAVEGEVPIFNVPGAVAALLGRFGWERAVKILSPVVWAPGWDDSQLEEFVKAPLLGNPWPFPEVSAPNLRASEFPGHGALADLGQPDYPQYDVIHVVGHVESPAGDPVLRLASTGRGLLPSGILRDALVAARTRLLILHVPLSESEDAARLAQLVAGGGGPAALSVAAGSIFQVGIASSGFLRVMHKTLRPLPPDPEQAGVLDAYFFNLYANIVHNLPLPQVMAAEGGQEARLMLRLFYGESAGDLLQFDRCMDELQERLESMRQNVGGQAQQFGEVRRRAARLLPVEHAVDLAEAAKTGEDAVNARGLLIDEQAQTLANIRHMTWHHESEGAVPLPHIADATEMLEAAEQHGPEPARRGLRAEPRGLGAAPSPPGAAPAPPAAAELERELAARAARAPRVLNANFADPGAGSVLNPRQALAAARAYDLLVDIGPRWDKQKSLVTGNAGFPEEALPPGKEGWDVQAVLVSDDFTPNLVSAHLWVPAGSGRSFPFNDGVPARDSGPVALRVNAPAFLENTEAQVIEARGRLLLYYENNLLQAAVVKVGVARSPDVALDKDNAVEVDFVLSGTFQDVDRLTARRVQLVSGEESAGHRVAVNLTLNDDGAVGHRLLVKDAPDVPPGWIAYDPFAAKQTLDNVRRQLADCFWTRDGTNGTVVTDWRGTPKDGLRQNNGKSRDQFLVDLSVLAQAGEQLYNMIITQVNTGDGGGAWKQWDEALRKALATTAVIQAARTTTVPPSYVFPWALVYDYPLPDKSRLRWCDVVNEWSDDGVRTLPPEPQCPFHDRDWHQKNVLCPYGFWGLKHIIEQPPSGLCSRDGSVQVCDTARKVLMGPKLALAIGVTSDASLDPNAIAGHLERLRNIQDVAIAPPDPADDWAKVSTALQAPEIVYFLCHGEFDAGKNEPYLGVGLRDDNLDHRVYPSSLTAWARTQDLTAWEKQRPLVFINGCHTANLEPGQVLNFVTVFTRFWAGGVVGTEVSIRLPLAIEVAERLLDKIIHHTPRIPVGQAVRDVRWELANKGNLLGLAYTPYCLADLQVVQDG